MERRWLEKREKPGLTGAKPQGPNSLEQALYGLKRGSTLGPKPELLDAAMDELGAGFEQTLVRSGASWSQSYRYRRLASYGDDYNSNPSALGVPKGDEGRGRPKSSVGVRSEVMGEWGAVVGTTTTTTQQQQRGWRRWCCC